MKIRTKLTLIFCSIVIIILSAVSLAIYFFSADYREYDFFVRMRNKAENTAKLLIEVDEVDVDLLKRIERDNPSNLPNERIRIFNYKNEEIYSSDSRKDLAVDIALLNLIRAKNEVRYNYKDYEVLGFVFAFESDRFIVVVGATDIQGFRKMENLKQILIIVFAASLILISFSGWVYSGRVLSPISSIVKEVDGISAANLSLRLKEGNGTDELAKLAQRFNRMLDRLEESFIAQKEFIANASHELRTPITAIAGEIEVTLMQPRSAEDYNTVLQSLLEDAKGLNNLSTQLLLLAHTSATNQQHKFAPVRVDEVLWQAKEDLSKVHRDYQIYIEFDIGLNDESLLISGDEQLIKVVFTNLLDNGCKYAPDKKINVTLTSKRSDLVITFINSSDNLSREDLENIFKPFYRGKNALQTRGSGIGLPLVNRITSLHQGKITVSSSHGQMIITLRLPTISLT